MKPSELTKALTHLIEQRRPCMIWGAPGVGKSDIIRQVAAKLERELRDVRLSTMDVVDVRGFPVPDLEQQVMKWLTANFLPAMTVKGKPNKTKGVLFLDELTSAPPAVQAAMYQLILDFRIGDYVLPEGWSIVAAGNRKSDRSVVHDMPAALANRLIHLDADVDVDEWDKWAAQNGISSVTRGFIRFREALLHKFDPNARAWPSGRTWEFVDRNIRGHNLPSTVELDLIKGAVGEGAAVEYHAFTTLAQHVPNIKDILAKPHDTPVPTEPSVLYATATMMDSHITPKTIKPALAYIERMPKEFQILTMRGALHISTEIESTQEYTDWLIKNAEFLR